MKAKCPVCNKAVDIKTNPWRPFCSKNCKIIDLWNWFHEYYAIKTEEVDENINTQEENDDKADRMRCSRKNGQ